MVSVTKVRAGLAAYENAQRPGQTVWRGCLATLRPWRTHTAVPTGWSWPAH